ncbi:SHOCT domain-containing protein [Pseudonocardiaceae bacterium YIM PH 21723]|nr:SHOCT domain-containing protein [Pseudonocardiaceae bacterium YIM PH 21723]
MAWQEELRKLDDLLAAGQISAEDYRRQRDEIIAEGVGNPQQGRGGDAFPPPFRWETQNDEPSPDATQVVSTNYQPQQQAPATPPPPPPPAHPEATQVVANPAAQQPNYANTAPDASSAPPWASAELPPMAANPGWLSQGPDVFDSGNSGGGGGKKVIGIVVALVVLAGIAFGAYWLFGRDSGNPGGGNTPAASSEAPKPKGPLDSADLGPTPQAFPEYKTVTDIEKSGNILVKEEVAAYKTAGASDVTVTGFDLGNGKYVSASIAKAADAAKAKAVPAELLRITLGNQATELTGLPAGVKGTQYDTTKGSWQLRAFYSSNGKIVRMEANAKTKDEALALLKDSIKKQLELHKADA